MNIESTDLYLQFTNRRPPAGPLNILDEFNRLRELIQEQASYIVVLFPEYTPHDHIRHLNHLFALADRILGVALYDRLNASEIALLAFGLFAHDWGMAVSSKEQQCLLTGSECTGVELIPNEPRAFQLYLDEDYGGDPSRESSLREYLRQTHGRRSGVRLRKYLNSISSVFAESVARIAEGHTLPMREIRDTTRYHHALSLFGETVNVAAIATYVRVIDLLDIGDDRTPFALWKFIGPSDPTSTMEWKKHRSLSPVAVVQGSGIRELVVNGCTDDPDVFAALADLQCWIGDEFLASIVHLRGLSEKYAIGLDSRIRWNVDPIGFEPHLIRFQVDRSQILGLLSRELYQDDPLAFVRELLQNSIDAIDAREALLTSHGLPFKGHIVVRLTSSASKLSIEWTDDGIGMNNAVLSAYFARLGCSWYQSREARSFGIDEPISRFGVGILSCFSVSNSLTVRTRRDPYCGGEYAALEARIPQRESHFRIRTVLKAPVGTTICLEIPTAFAKKVSVASIKTALARIASYVRHSVKLESDGFTTEIAPNTVHPEVKIQSMRGDAAMDLAELTKPVGFVVGGLDRDFQGYFSTLIPMKLGEVHATSDDSMWELEGRTIELDDVLCVSEHALFVKGVRAGPVARGDSMRAARSSGILGESYSAWSFPALHLNVQRPSLVEFDLARASVRLRETNWQSEVWREIAKKLRAEMFPEAFSTDEEAALIVGSCAVFGAIPDEGLDALIAREESPILILEAGRGLVWSSLSKLTQVPEFAEAPFELGYSFSSQTAFQGFGKDSGLLGWNGEGALFAPESGFNAKKFPWLGPILRYAQRKLGDLGWLPVAIRCVHGVNDESCPLVTRVWRHVGAADIERDKKWDVMRALYGEAPELLQFPDELSCYVGIGSRYWNANNAKALAIVSVLSELLKYQSEGHISLSGSGTFEYLCSHTFYDYVVPSRMSGQTLAVELINKLLHLAAREGLPVVEELSPRDFFPGTIGKYRNPYHFDLSAWRIGSERLGKPYVNCR